jgi:hypothetical protein
MEGTERNHLPQRNREHEEEGILKILKLDPKRALNFFSIFFPELRVLCVFAVNPILRALFPFRALPLPLAASVGFLYNRRVRSKEFRYGFAFKF